MPPKPAPLPDFTAITIKAFAQSLPILFDLFIVKLWWLWLIMMGIGYLRKRRRN